MKKYLLLSALAALTLLFISCPEPLTEDIVTSALDKLPPTIEVFSPGENDTYYAQVDFSLRVSDDSLEEGDGKGDVASIAFEISNDDFRGGKILISTEGVVSRDNNAGSDPITYDPESGNLDFSFSTVEPSILDGLLSVTVIVADRNGNETEEKVPLYENEGPWFDFTILNNDGVQNLFTENETVTLTGSVANSSDDLTSASDIYRIEWNISNILVAELILDEEETYVDPYDAGTELNYYNSSTGLYEAVISGYLLEANANSIVYDPSDGTFSAVIFMKNQFKSLGTLSFEFEVEDKSGHVSTENILLSLDVDLPDIGATNALSDGTYGHFSANGQSDTISLICGDDFSNLSIEYYLKSGSYQSAPVDLSTGSGTSYPFTLSSAKMAELIADPGSVEDVSLIVTAINDEDVSVSMSLPLKVDSEGPGLENFSFSNPNPDIPGNSAYANEDNTLDVSYDAINEIEGSVISMELTIGGKSFSYNETVQDDPFSEDPLPITVTESNISGWSTGQSQGAVPISITMTDRLLNSKTYTNISTEVGDEVIYYPSNGGNLALSGMSVILSADDTDPEFDWPEEALWARSGETMTLTINPGAREIESISNIQIAGVDANEDSTYVFSSSNTDSAVSGSKIKQSYTIVDKAGNIYTSVDADSVITYDNIDPVPTLASGSLEISIADDGTTIPSEYLSAAMLLSNMTLELSGLDTIVDGKYHGFRYKTFDDEYSDFIDTGVNTSYSVTLDDDPIDNPMSGAAQGPYIGTVKFYDEAGNSSNEFPVDFTIDLDDPSLDVVSFKSSYTSNATVNLSYAKKTDKAILIFRSSDNPGSGMADPSEFNITINGIDVNTPSSVTGDEIAGFEYTYELLLTLDPDNNDNGYIPFTAEVEDNAGNKKSVSLADTADNIKYYATPLNENMGIIMSSEQDVDELNDIHWAKDTENITVTATSPNRDLYSSSIIYNSDSGDKALTVKTGEDNDASRVFEYNMDNDGLDKDGDGVLSFDLSFTDMAGNPWVEDSVTAGTGTGEGSYPIIYDNTSPNVASIAMSLSDSDTSSNGKSGVKGIYLNSYADNGETADFSGIVETNYAGFTYSITGSSTITTPSEKQSGFSVDLTDLIDKDDGTYTISIDFWDFAGNSTPHSETIELDEEVPTVSDITYYAPGIGEYAKYAKEGERITLEFTANDPSGSGFDSGVTDVVKIKDTTATLVGTDYSSREYYVDIPVDDNSVDAIIPIDILIMDKAGNISDPYDEDAAADSVTYYYGSPKSKVTLNYSGPTKYGNIYIAVKDQNFKVDYTSTRVLDKIIGQFSTESSSHTKSDAGTSGTWDTDSVTNSDTTIVDEEFSITFNLTTVEDMAGNTCTMDNTDIISDVLRYDNKDPDITKINFGLSGLGSNGDYVNIDGTDIGTFLSLLDTSEVDLNYATFEYKVDGSPSSWSSDISGTTLSMSDAGVSVADGIAFEDYTFQVRVTDLLGNTSAASALYTFYVDTVRPTVSSVTSSGSTNLDVHFSDPHKSAAGDGFSLSASSSVAYLDADSLRFTAVPLTTFSGSFFLYTPVFTDFAGNASYTNYTINYDTLSLGAISGIDYSFMNLQPEIIPDDNTDSTSTSYSTIRTYDYASKNPVSSDQSLTSSELSESLVSTEISELNALKKATSYSNVPVSFRTGGVALEIAVPERILEDLNTSNNPVKDVMDQVTLNEAEYKAAIESLMTPKLSRKRLNKMERIMEPELVEPEMLTVSATPFLMGAATEVSVVVSDSEMGEEASGALLIQILVALAMALLSIGFVLVLKKMSRT